MGHSSSRRNFRKRRPALEVGQENLKGKVVVFYKDQGFGFIHPDNNAARIIFFLNDVPYDRQKCVGVGMTVYFDVKESGEIVRGGYKKPRLVACVR